MGRTPAVQLAPGVWRIPSAPADLVGRLLRHGRKGFVNELAGAA